MKLWLNQTAHVPLEKIRGFRAPFLMHSPAQREILAQNGELAGADVARLLRVWQGWGGRARWGCRSLVSPALSSDSACCIAPTVLPSPVLPAPVCRLPVRLLHPRALPHRHLPL